MALLSPPQSQYLQEDSNLLSSKNVQYIWLKVIQTLKHFSKNLRQRNKDDQLFSESIKYTYIISPLMTLVIQVFP